MEGKEAREDITYRTSAGGLAKRRSDGRMIFIEPPDEFFKLHIGDEVPETWEVWPENEPAKYQARLGK
ncbi:MAG TPA: hypothetical protein PLF30_02055 [Candidatus Moranbacteria bacterium]|jgi:hypothetical protein|nr:hypothetical protein [Candidatus Moranbacteria bacterium]HOF42629.1 hypothetical protein [Candidatus Moranbacteria bacterium]HPX94319.1 hypothetical protein [Candidatus Moranbacteria bacterium]HQB59597.1 hypothetical protein [Candidatus Moranbacteria bacterium]